MLEKYNRYKVLKIFLDSPTERFRLREIARLAKISPPSVMNYLKEFEEENLIKRKVKNDIPFYTADRDNQKFISYKKMSIVYELEKTGVIEYLWDKLSPEVIILYGSHAKGEAVENSDMDLFIMGIQNEVDLAKFEKVLDLRFHLLYAESIEKLPKELANNILNGVILKGYIRVF